MGLIYLLVLFLLLYIAWPEKRPRIERPRKARRLILWLPW